ncbi:MAG: SemiSWEET family transporter [Minisyncoccia bacterium]
MIGFHHMRARAQVSGGLEPFPATSASKRYLDYLMYGVGVAAPLALLPQIIQIYTTHSSVGVSLSTWLMLMFFNTLWTVYGAVHKDMHLLLANTSMMIFHIIMVVGILLY